MQRWKKRIFLTAATVFLMIQSVLGTTLVVPGGQVIGIQIENDTVTVSGFHQTLGEKAKAAGLQVGDRIIAINGTAVHSAADVKSEMGKNRGQLSLSVLRKGKAKKLTFFPEVTQEGAKLGVYLKEGITGVGTVTWYDPQTETFGALGHGVSDESGALIPMEQGHIYKATVIGVEKGKTGAPGQLMGAITQAAPSGEIDKNTHQGIFGEGQLEIPGQPLPLGTKEQVKPGKATIRSTVKDGTVQDYSVEILKVYATGGSNGRNMLLKVTDPALLSATGGIVQGMSGSPIIQDGYLVGAVTHVLVNDPTSGYGIFIENMLNAA